MVIDTIGIFKALIILGFPILCSNNKYDNPNNRIVYKNSKRNDFKWKSHSILNMNMNAILRPKETKIKSIRNKTTKHLIKRLFRFN